MKSLAKFVRGKWTLIVSEKLNENKIACKFESVERPASGPPNVILFFQRTGSGGQMKDDFSTEPDRVGKREMSFLTGARSCKKRKTNNTARQSGPTK